MHLRGEIEPGDLVVSTKAALEPRTRQRFGLLSSAAFLVGPNQLDRSQHMLLHRFQQDRLMSVLDILLQIDIVHMYVCRYRAI